jgi:hypothetical protein
MAVTYETEILREGNHASLEIPDAVLAELRAHKRAPLIVSVNGHSYRSTAVGVDGGCRVVFPQREREGAGVSVGLVAVRLQLDSGYREVDIPPELAAVLTQSNLHDEFNGFSYSQRRLWSRSVIDAKRHGTKMTRIEEIVGAIRRRLAP